MFFLFHQPRLGPKPFSSVSADITFDQTFSVPSAPGSLEEADVVELAPLPESLPVAAESSPEDANEDKVVMREKPRAESTEGSLRKQLSIVII